MCGALFAKALFNRLKAQKSSGAASGDCTGMSVKGIACIPGFTLHFLQKFQGRFGGIAGGFIHVGPNVVFI